MSLPRSGPAGALPRQLVVCGSVAIVGHLASVLVAALAAPSGPWPTAFGSSMATEPQFARTIGNITTRHYLTPLEMGSNYHFTTNRPASTAVYFEVHLRDTAGNLLKTLRFPDDQANFWVRHRQRLLAQALTDDLPVEARGGEVIAAPQQQVRTVPIWDTDGEHGLRLRSVPEHLVPRDRPVFRPSGWSLLLARSYVRYLCRAHGAATGELVRHTREPILPAVLLMDEPPPGTFDELVSSFGETPR
jgi:hypothetical protein